MSKAMLLAQALQALTWNLELRVHSGDSCPQESAPVSPNDLQTIDREPAEGEPHLRLPRSRRDR